VQSIWLVNEKKTSIILIQALSGGICALLLNSWLVPAYQIYGALASLIAAQFLQALLVPWLFCPSLLAIQFGARKRIYSVNNCAESIR
jgi:hypothetical protein